MAVLFLVVLGVTLQRLAAWGAESGGAWLRATWTWFPNWAVQTIEWILGIIAGVGVFAGVIFLMPAATALVAAIFADDIAAEVEKTYYPNDPPGAALPIARSLWESVKAALLSIGVYLLAVPFLLFGGAGAVIFFVATAFLLSREYFNLAAMRFRPPPEAKALRKAHSGEVWGSGLMIAALVSIPVVNFVTPLFATALMVHMHKRLAESR
jgi:CysZ protein